MIFWLVLKLRDIVIKLYYLEGLWFLFEDYLKIIVLHGEIFEFP
jgi:hypothetical protein